MRRPLALCLAALVALQAVAVVAAPREDELARARVLDQEGVRAYKDGRYNDAISYFAEAFKLGGPASELWNIARCHMKLDEPQEASDAYERYLAQIGLSAQDKAEATKQLEELRQRRSILTVASAPSKAAVYLDGRRTEPLGTTPFSVQLAPGTHKVEILQRGYAPYSQEVEAKLGRAIIVDAQLKAEPAGRADGSGPGPAVVAPPVAAPKRLTAQAELGPTFSRLGSSGQPGHLGFSLGAAYWLTDTPRGMFGIGLRLAVTTDSWGNTVNAPTRGVVGCAVPISGNLDGTEVSGFLVGLAGYRVTPRFRVGGDLGLGAAGYAATPLGGDLFYPTCHPATGAQVAAHAGVELSYAVHPLVRLLATPLSLAVHPAYDGARAAPLDASGLWLRLSLGLGLAVDL